MRPLTEQVILITGATEYDVSNTRFDGHMLSENPEQCARSFTSHIFACMLYKFA